MPRYLLLAAVLFPSTAFAQPRVVAHQRAVGVINPMGVEHMVAPAVRTSLHDGDDLLLRDTYAEVGAASYTSPIYQMSGGYLEISPVAFLVLRAQLTQMQVWPIGMPGAGYYGTDNDALPPLDGERGASASGFDAVVSALLQGAYGVGAFRAILWNELSFEHLICGHGRPLRGGAREALRATIDATF